MPRFVLVALLDISSLQTNESILALDLKASSKEQALSANHSSEEHQEMEAMKAMISELTSQRENDLVRIQVRSPCPRQC